MQLLLDFCKFVLLGFKDEWHQYDDMIHPKLITSSNTALQTVTEGRDQAGKEMLKTIFDLLTSWNEDNVENFFTLLQQFIHTYSCPLLHDGKKRQWELPYDEKKANMKFFSFCYNIANFGSQKRVQSLIIYIFKHNIY